ncbi:MAG: FliI/YscN family ATPase [Erythrobacter sp.]|jgi:type III secretion protein N (ATPase)|nr:FliI/YscN family ATPase [Erythrobacter sp.]
MRSRTTIAALARALHDAPLVEQRGTVVEALGTTLKVSGISARIGDTCEIRKEGAQASPPLTAEVIGFASGIAILTPLGATRGLSPADEIILVRSELRIPFGEHMLGRVMDCAARPLDGKGAIPPIPSSPLHRDPPSPLDRKPIDRVLETGIRAIDGLLPLGEGQRIGIFAAAGSGKSTLLAMMARHGEADAFVIALIGERGREVREFIEDALGPEGMAKAVVVVATSDRPAKQRVRAAEVATAIAEGFRDQGRHVVLMMDSITRYARAQREIGLAAGEPPVRRGYPPSLFAELPVLLERAGTSDKGAITAIYTVLLEDEEGDPVGEEVRSLLDGHIQLTRRLAGAGHYPAIDINASLSRLSGRITSPEMRHSAMVVRRALARLGDIELLVQMGEYSPGDDPLADAALSARPMLDDFLRQDVHQPTGLTDTNVSLRALAENLDV